MTFHSEEQNELEDVTKNTKLDSIWPIKNHPRIATHQDRTKNSMELMWDLWGDYIQKYICY
jgi:hypothetical protein